MKKRWTLIAVVLLTVGLLSQGIAQAGVILPGFNANSYPANDDGYTGFLSLGFTANYFGTDYTGLFANNNGNVTFNSGQSTYTPYGLGSGYTGQPIIAPFFADVDTRGTGSGLMQYGTGTYGSHNAFGVTWVGVGYYNRHTDKLNSFQVVLIDRIDTGTGNFDIMFNYDQVKWETGDASGGSGGLGGISAAVGFSKGTAEAGTYYQFPGSLVPGSFLDSNLPTGLINNTNMGLDGRYVFEVRNGGAPEPPPPPVPLPPSVLMLGSCLVGLGGWRFIRKPS